MPSLRSRPFTAFLLCLFLTGHAWARYDDGARYAFVPSADDKSVYVIDLNDRALAHRIELPIAPDSIATSEQLKALIIANEMEQRLMLIDLSSDELTQIDYPLDISPSYVSVSPPGDAVLVYDRGKRTVQVHAIRRREILLHADDVLSQSNPVFSADGASIYWSDDTQGTFNAIDLWSKRRSVRLAEGQVSLSAATRSIDGSLAFVSDARNNSVHVIDLAKFVSLIQVKVGKNPGRAWGTTDGRFMLVPNRDDATITAISTLSGAIHYTVAAVPAPQWIHPGWLDTTAAVVGSNGDLAFLEIDSGRKISELKLGGSPAAGVVTSDSRTLAMPVTTQGFGQVVLFDMRQRSAFAAISRIGKGLGDASLAISNNLCH